MGKELPKEKQFGVKVCRERKCEDLQRDPEHPDSPGFQLPCSLSIEGKEFAEAIKALASIGDKVRFSIKGAMLELSTEGDIDLLKKEITGKLPDGKKNEIEAVSLFSLDYMREITKGGMKGAETITISLGVDHPVRFDFEVEGIEASYVLAPRIEQEAA